MTYINALLLSVGFLNCAEGFAANPKDGAAMDALLKKAKEDFSHACDLSHYDFTQGGTVKVLDGKHLKGISFQNANLKAANFEGMTLKNIHFEKADLTGANFRNCHFISSGFVDETILTNVNFINSTFSMCGFRNIILRNVTFENATLSQVSFYKVSMEAVNFANSTLTKCSFEEILKSHNIIKTGSKTSSVSGFMFL